MPKDVYFQEERGLRRELRDDLIDFLWCRKWVTAEMVHTAFPTYGERTLKALVKLGGLVFERNVLIADDGTLVDYDDQATRKDKWGTHHETPPTHDIYYPRTSRPNSHRSNKIKTGYLKEFSHRGVELPLLRKYGGNAARNDFYDSGYHHYGIANNAGGNESDWWSIGLGNTMDMRYGFLDAMQAWFTDTYGDTDHPQYLTFGEAGEQTWYGVSAQIRIFDEKGDLTKVFESVYEDLPDPDSDMDFLDFFKMSNEYEKQMVVVENMLWVDECHDAHITLKDFPEIPAELKWYDPSQHWKNYHLREPYAAWVIVRTAAEQEIGAAIRKAMRKASISIDVSCMDNNYEFEGIERENLVATMIAVCPQLVVDVDGEDYSNKQIVYVYHPYGTLVGLFDPQTGDYQEGFAEEMQNVVANCLQHSDEDEPYILKGNMPTPEHLSTDADHPTIFYQEYPDSAYFETVRAYRFIGKTESDAAQKELPALTLEEYVEKKSQS
jgi:hypothetical protein